MASVCLCATPANSLLALHFATNKAELQNCGISRICLTSIEVQCPNLYKLDIYGIDGIGFHSWYLEVEVIPSIKAVV